MLPIILSRVISRGDFSAGVLPMFRNFYRFHREQSENRIPGQRPPGMRQTQFHAQLENDLDRKLNLAFGCCRPDQLAHYEIGVS
jgi:hypothetical protein